MKTQAESAGTGEGTSCTHWSEGGRAEQSTCLISVEQTGLQGEHITVGIEAYFTMKRGSVLQDDCGDGGGLVTSRVRLLRPDPVDCSLPGSLWPWDFPGKNTGVGCHFLLQGIFLTKGSNLGLSCIVGRFTIANIYVFNNNSKMHKKKTERKNREATGIVRYFNTTLLIIDRTVRQKISE